MPPAAFSGVSLTTPVIKWVGGSVKGCVIVAVATFVETSPLDMKCDTVLSSIGSHGHRFPGAGHGVQGSGHFPGAEARAKLVMFLKTQVVLVQPPNEPRPLAALVPPVPAVDGGPRW